MSNNDNARQKALNLLGFSENASPSDNELEESIRKHAREAHDSENNNIQDHFEKIVDAYYFLKLPRDVQDTTKLSDNFRKPLRLTKARESAEENVKYSVFMKVYKFTIGKIFKLAKAREGAEENVKKYSVFMKIYKLSIDKHYKKETLIKRIDFNDLIDLQPALEDSTEIFILRSPANRLPKEAVVILKNAILSKNSYNSFKDQSFLFTQAECEEIKNISQINAKRIQKETLMHDKKYDQFNLYWVGPFAIVGGFLGFWIASSFTVSLLGMCLWGFIGESIREIISKRFVDKNYIATCKDPKILETIYTKDEDIEALQLGVKAKDWIPYLKSFGKLEAYRYGPFRTALEHAVLGNQEVLDSIASMKRKGFSH